MIELEWVVPESQRDAQVVAIELAGAMERNPVRKRFVGGSPCTNAAGARKAAAQYDTTGQAPARVYSAHTDERKARHRYRRLGRTRAARPHRPPGRDRA